MSASESRCRLDNSTSVARGSTRAPRVFLAVILTIFLAVFLAVFLDVFLAVFLAVFLTVYLAVSLVVFSTVYLAVSLALSGCGRVPAYDYFTVSGRVPATARGTKLTLRHSLVHAATIEGSGKDSKGGRN